MTSPEIIPEPEPDPSDNDETDIHLNELTMHDFLDIAKWFNSTPEMLSSATSFIKSGYPIGVGLQILGISPAQVQSWQRIRRQQQQHIRLGVENIRSTAEYNLSYIRKLGKISTHSIRSLFR
jgi:hypothetical protein